MKRTAISTALATSLLLISQPGHAQEGLKGWKSVTFDAGQFGELAQGDGRRPYRVVGDFNGDGLDDIALVGGPGWTTIPIAYSKGNGDFDVVEVPVGDFGKWAADAVPLVGDFNGDGISDIALGGGAGMTTMPVAYGKKSGGLTIENKPVGEFTAWAASARKLVGDFNGDGRDDVALLGGEHWATAPVAFSLPSGGWKVSNDNISHIISWNRIYDYSVGDFNGDGRDDIAFDSATAFSDGNGGWTASPVGKAAIDTVAPGKGRNRIALNADSFEDRIQVKYNYMAHEETIVSSISTGDGGWKTATQIVSFPEHPTSTTAVIGDFNGDKLTDIMFINPKSSTAQVALADGTGHWKLFPNYLGAFPSWTATGSLLVGDFNGDGISDLAIVGGKGLRALPVLLSE